ncbi:hypothetical protein IMSAGC019_03963 [Lachnospiraceae bacterium]|nr:hypothetical protein IMSAGC019_03963 [Lachnospiraceae bacterium]
MTIKMIQDELRELSNYTYMKNNVNIQRMLNQFSKENLIGDIRWINTYATSMFPFIELSKESSVLVWDEHFFNLFDLYIQICISEETFDEKVRLLQDFSLLMLSHRFDSIPSLSYAFAMVYDALNTKRMIKGQTSLGYYDDSLQDLKMTNSQLEMSFFSRIFVMYHEMRHYRYRKNLDYNNKQAIQYLTKIRHQIYRTLNPFKMPLFAGHPAHAYMINEINYMIDNNDFHAIEEFACDLFACFDLIKLLLREYKGKKSDEIQFAYQIASTVSMFLSDSMTFFDVWEKIYRNRKNGNYRKYVNNAFSLYERDMEDITIDEVSVKHHFRSRLLFYCLYHHYNNDDEFLIIDNLFPPNQQFLLINGQKLLVDGLHTEILLGIEQANREKYTQQQCRAEKDKILHWY